MNVLIIKMGGVGSRFGNELPKQFTLVDGMPLFCHIISAYEKTGLIAKYVLATNEKYIHLTKRYASAFHEKLDIEVICGGQTGGSTAANAIRNLSGKMAKEDLVLIHDAANALVLTEKMAELIALAKIKGCAVLCCREVHAVYAIADSGLLSKSIDKSRLAKGYSPEIFQYGLVASVFSRADEVSIRSAQSTTSLCLEHGVKVYAVLSDFPNIKITYPDDLILFQNFIASKNEEEIRF